MTENSDDESIKQSPMDLLARRLRGGEPVEHSEIVAIFTEFAAAAYPTGGDFRWSFLGVVCTAASICVQTQVAQDEILDHIVNSWMCMGIKTSQQAIESINAMLEFFSPSADTDDARKWLTHLLENPSLVEIAFERRDAG